MKVLWWALAAALTITANAAVGPQGVQSQDFEPTVGQPGRDVVWVPTPEPLVEKMLDLAQVTTADVVVDLGSGDGRNVIAAAKRGAQARGVEFNPDMVALSRRHAEMEGVSERATFVEGDMFDADISDATVLALFLLPDNLRRLRDRFLDLRPGTRIVANTFGIPDWEADQRLRIEDDCSSWCEALLFIVPAKVAGSWRMSDDELELEQHAQMVSGTLAVGGQRLKVSGQLRGDQIAFSVNDARYQGRVFNDSMEGSVTLGGGAQIWSATRVQ